MNEIRVKQMFVAGLAMFLVWIALEILLEQMIGRLLFGSLIDDRWLEMNTSLNDWNGWNHLVNLLIPLFNTTLLIWLYASLRPMYGVGTKTALITSALGVALGLSVAINVVNLGLLPLRVGLKEAVFEAIEFPIAMIAGAAVYEGAGDKKVF
jgi:hypothetical protein